ncbi:MAG: DUF2905 domain-containing protein [Elusimicrobiales bacterium]|nr:DUF2905 domain-containing protein [Elusimicrobiales bacterium]
MNYIFSGFGKFLILAGIVLILLGIFVLFTPNIPYLGKLPGDIHIKKGNFTFYMPLTTSLVISLVLTLILTILSKK